MVSILLLINFLPFFLVIWQKWLFFSNIIVIMKILIEVIQYCILYLFDFNDASRAPHGDWNHENVLLSSILILMHLTPLTEIETLLYVHIYLDGLRRYLAPLRKLKRFYQFHFSLIKRTMHFYMIPIIYFSWSVFLSMKHQCYSFSYFSIIHWCSLLPLS